jgi:Na+-driven multidrug efflux pump
LILIYARFILGDTDWISGIGYVIFALLLLFISLVVGLSASITALIALNRTKDDGDDPMVRRLANLGLTLGLASVLLILIFFVVTWIFSSNAPPPDISTPIPATAVP